MYDLSALEFLLHEVKKPEAIVLDYEGPLVPTPVYLKKGKHDIIRYSMCTWRNSLNLVRWYRGIQFIRNVDKYDSAKQITLLAYLCENARERRVEQFGEEMMQHIRPRLLKFLQNYPEVPKAIISFDDRRVVKPTMRKIGADRAITNLMVGKNGRISEKGESVGIGVEWPEHSPPMLNGEDKLRAFRAVLESYRNDGFDIDLDGVVYFGDAEADILIMRFLNQRSKMTVAVRGSPAQKEATYAFD